MRTQIVPQSRLLSLALLLVLVFTSACASAGQPDISPTATVPGTPVPTAGIKLPEGAQQILAKPLAQIIDSFGLAAGDITVKSMEETMWPDSCLGVSLPNMMCAQVVTPGYLIILTTPLGEFEVHTDKTGDNFRLVPPQGSELSSPVIVFERSGGIAGICYNLKVDAKGGYIFQDCKTNAAALTGSLQPAEMATITAWLEKYGSFQWESNNPKGSADMFNDLLIFNGKGSAQPDAALQQEILDFLANLAAQLSTSGQTSGAGTTSGTGITSSTATTSGIEGQVLIGPACPGPVRVDTPCPDQPYQAAFSVLSPARELVTQFRTDAKGNFRLSLAPGSYILHAEIQGALPRLGDQEVVVAAGKYTHLELHFDSGIR